MQKVQESAHVVRLAAFYMILRLILQNIQLKRFVTIVHQGHFHTKDQESVLSVIAVNI